MSYVLKKDGLEIARSGGWNPLLFGKHTGTSFADAVPDGWTWAQDGYLLAWEIDPPPPPQTAEEIAAAELWATKNQLHIDAKASAIFANLKGATLAQINTFVDNNFAAMNATQRNFIKLLAASASLYLQDR